MGNVIAKYAFFPPTPPTYDQSLEGLFFISHGNEAIPAVLHTIPDFEEQHSDPFVILFTHGNAEDIGPDTQAWLRYFSLALNAHILSYDYTGYGLNQPGIPNGKNCYRNIEAVWNYLIDVRKYSPKRIILLGRSIGSGPTVHLAAKLFSRSRKVQKRLDKLKKSPNKDTQKMEILQEEIDRLPGAIILQSPIASCIRVLSNALATALPFDLFSNVKKIHRITCPVTIIHGTNDTVVPFEHSKMLWRNYTLKDVGQFVALNSADHNNIEVTNTFRDDYIACIRKLLKDLQNSERVRVRSDLLFAEVEQVGQSQSSIEMIFVGEHGSTTSVGVSQSSVGKQKEQQKSADSDDEAMTPSSSNQHVLVDPCASGSSLRTEKHDSVSSARYCTVSSQEFSSGSQRSDSSSPKISSERNCIRTPSLVISVDSRLLCSDLPGTLDEYVILNEDSFSVKSSPSPIATQSEEKVGETLSNDVIDGIIYKEETDILKEEKGGAQMKEQITNNSNDNQEIKPRSAREFNEEIERGAEESDESFDEEGDDDEASTFVEDSPPRSETVVALDHYYLERI